jgi:hypothetical protein
MTVLLRERTALLIRVKSAGLSWVCRTSMARSRLTADSISGFETPAGLLQQACRGLLMT